MKISTLFITLSFLLITISNYAQEQITDVQELLSRMQENHMGSLNDVFNTEELQTLQAYFNSVNPPNEEELVLANRRIASTKGNTPVAVVTMNPQDLTTLENLGPSTIPEFEGAGIVITMQNGAYVIDNGNNVYLRGISNNNYVPVGAVTNVPVGESITGLETLSNGDMYAISTNGMNSSHLLMINPNTWEAMPIGGNNGLVVPIALARDGADRLITVDLDDDNAYVMQAATGAPTLMGPIGFDANFGQGMGYDAEVDKVLLTAFNNTLGDSQLREMNTTTGLTVSLGTITPGVIDQFGYGSFYDADLLDLQGANPLDFSVYPNPVIDILKVQSNVFLYQIDIYALDGSKVMSITPQHPSTEIDMRALSSGFYLMTIQLEGTTYTHKFIKE